MSLGLNPSKSPRRELSRIILRQLDEAGDLLRSLVDHPDAVDLEHTVHSVRKRCKEVRGLARMLRPALGKRHRTFDVHVRTAGATLGTLRDSHVLVATLTDLSPPVQTPQFLIVLHALEASTSESVHLSLETPHLVEDAADQIEAARSIARQWKIPKGFGVLADGSANTYNRGRIALAAAAHGQTDKELHAYRTRVKRLWYQIRFFEPLAPSVLSPLVGELDWLGDALGDDHDLAVLISTLEADSATFGGAEAVADVVALAEAKRFALQEQALRVGRTVYADTPDAFGTRMRSYRTTTKKFGPEADRTESTADTAPHADTWERERKWLVDAVPEDLTDGTRMRQGYLASHESLSLRIRDAGPSGCTVTIKTGGGATRTELEWPIDLDVFERLWPLTEGQRVSKTRYRIPSGGRVVELDIFHEDLDGFVVAEVEFSSDEELRDYIAPEWFGLDVTDDGRYTNASLAAHGLPDEATYPAG